VSDVLRLGTQDGAAALRLQRDARAFFQANRFLLEALVQHVIALVPDGPIVDLYAGVGLFGLARAATGGAAVTLVEGDPISGRDLDVNAAPFAERVRVERSSVEAFLQRMPAAHDAAFIVDPPRTGMSKEALAGIVRVNPNQIVYVSCDVATLARDARGLADAGYALDGLTCFDLFPNTAHVEGVGTFRRA
jgi:23S rRNA (uracil1939-C5)-methyltransferase